ncbi:MAG: alpha/beta fold hydrolase [Burkholderiales bacterium]
MHGIARLAHTLDHLAPHFSADYHVIAVDLRGHGESTWDPHAAYCDRRSLSRGGAVEKVIGVEAIF